MWVRSVVHLCIVFIECLKSLDGLVVLTPRFRAVTLKDSWKIELHFMLNAHMCYILLCLDVVDR